MVRSKREPERAPACRPMACSRLHLRDLHFCSRRRPQQPRRCQCLRARRRQSHKSGSQGSLARTRTLSPCAPPRNAQLTVETVPATASPAFRPLPRSLLGVLLATSHDDQQFLSRPVNRPDRWLSRRWKCPSFPTETRPRTSKWSDP